jgi:hypothetical protein
MTCQVAEADAIDSPLIEGRQESTDRQRVRSQLAVREEKRRAEAPNQHNLIHVVRDHPRKLVQ